MPRHPVRDSPHGGTQRGVGDLSWRGLRLFPAKTAIEDGDVRITYGELDARADRVATLLRRHGIRNGDRVLLLLPNNFRFVESFLGTLRAGASAVLGNTKLSAETLGYVAEHSEASALVTHASLRDRIEGVRASASRMRLVLAAGGDVPDALPYDDTLAGVEPDVAASADVDPDDEALLMYTSGSSGVPKGCRLSHRNTWWQARSSARTMLLDESDKALIMGPLYHANALWAGMLPMLYVGGALTILPGFDADEVLTVIERDRPTYMSGTPSMFSLLLARHERSPGRDLSSIRLLLCGSAPVPEELMTALGRVFDADLVESYGLTEGGANVVTPRWGIKKVGSTGLPVPGVEIRVVDPEDPTRDCATGKVGELWSRSAANALGYLKQPDATRERFLPDGWLRTGDLVRRDEQGYVYICGRVDDMINVGGENVYPKEVESVLLAHPQIEDVCVVAARHAVKGAAPVAWVVLREAESLSEDDVKRYYLDRGPAYAHPRRVFFVDELPVSGTNKLDRRALEEEAARLLPDGLPGGAG